ncbi:hypothetical protein BURPSPAST_T0256 [Burkholderia pseudomallei Pasteur 52237]|nr:hypothetical protein BURPSPAST_T0256 [Burkholderia pseudomallei Pasteur 52237]
MIGAQTVPHPRDARSGVTPARRPPRPCAIRCAAHRACPGRRAQPARPPPLAAGHGACWSPEKTTNGGERS